MTKIITKLKTFFKRRSLERKAKARIAQEKLEWYSRPVSERLAMGTCEWVKLKWNGELQEFLLNNINVADLAVSGKYPNVIVYFMKLAKDATKSKDDDILEDKIDMQAVKQEEQALYEEVARKSMMSPTFQEVYDAILKVRNEKGIEVEVTCVRDVIPYDFLQDLFRYHLERWVASIKKNLNLSTSTVSAE